MSEEKNEDNDKLNKTNSKTEVVSKNDKTIYEEEIEVIIDEDKAKEEQSRKKYSTKLADSGGCIYGDINRGAKA